MSSPEPTTSTQNQEHKMYDLIKTIFVADLSYNECRIESEADERELIRLAKRGDSSATERLLLAYAPALRRGFADWRRASGRDAWHADAEDAQMDFILALLEVIKAFDLGGKHDRLAGIVTQFVRGAQRALAEQDLPFHVPSAVLGRFFATLRAAEGDVILAAALAPEHSLSKDAFAAILSGLRGRVGLPLYVDDDTAEVWDFISSHAPDFTDAIDNTALARQALEAMTEEERAVSLYAYGFAEYQPLSDAEITERLPMSRATVQRRRASGVHSARLAISTYGDLDVYASV